MHAEFSAMFLPESCLIVPHARARGNCGETIKQIRQLPHHMRTRQRRRFAERCGRGKQAKKSRSGKEDPARGNCRCLTQRRGGIRRGAEAASGAAQRQHPVRRRGGVRRCAEAVPGVAQRRRPARRRGGTRCDAAPLPEIGGPRASPAERPAAGLSGKKNHFAQDPDGAPKPLCPIPHCRSAPTVRPVMRPAAALRRKSRSLPFPRSNPGMAPAGSP